MKRIGNVTALPFFPFDWPGWNRDKSGEATLRSQQVTEGHLVSIWVALAEYNNRLLH